MAILNKFLRLQNRVSDKWRGFQWGLKHHIFIPIHRASINWPNPQIKYNNGEATFMNCYPFFIRPIYL